MAKTLIPGTKNKNAQTVIGPTGRVGTDHNQRVYELRCDNPEGCNGRMPSYGANGSDAHLRKCPLCQGGRPGI